MRREPRCAGRTCGRVHEAAVVNEAAHEAAVVGEAREPAVGEEAAHEAAVIVEAHEPAVVGDASREAAVAEEAHEPAVVEAAAHEAAVVEEAHEPAVVGEAAPARTSPPGKRARAEATCDTPSHTSGKTESSLFWKRTLRRRVRESVTFAARLLLMPSGSRRNADRCCGKR